MFNFQHGQSDPWDVHGMQDWVETWISNTSILSIRGKRSIQTKGQNINAFIPTEQNSVQIFCRIAFDKWPDLQWGVLCKTIKNVIEPILFVFKAVNDFANFNVDDPESVSVCASVYIMSVSRKGFLGIYWSHHQQTCQSDCLRHDNASRVNYLDLGLYSRSHRS